MKTKNEDIIRKLFESKCSLSPEERAALNNYEYVNDTFHRHYEKPPNKSAEKICNQYSQRKDAIKKKNL